MIDPKDPARLKLRAAAQLLAVVLAALAAEEALLAQLGAPVWLIATLALVAGWLGLRQPGTLPVAPLSLLVGLLVALAPLGCAHSPTVVHGVDLAASTALGLDIAIEPIETAEAAKAREVLDEIRDALEVLRALAPAIDAEIAARTAEVR